jgi:hypothetical protein
VQPENVSPAPPPPSLPQAHALSQRLQTESSTASGRRGPPAQAGYGLPSRGTSRTSPSQSQTQNIKNWLRRRISFELNSDNQFYPTTSNRSPGINGINLGSSPSDSRSQLRPATPNSGYPSSAGTLRTLSEPSPQVPDLERDMNSSPQPNLLRSRSGSMSSTSPSFQSLSSGMGGSMRLTKSYVASPTTSSSMGEPIPDETNLAIAISASLLLAQEDAASGSASSQQSSSLSRLREPIPHEPGLVTVKSASPLPNPPGSRSFSMPSTSSSYQSWTSELIPSTTSSLSELSYETALAKAISASLLSAQEEGVFGSASAQQSSSPHQSTAQVASPSAPQFPSESSTWYPSVDLSRSQLSPLHQAVDHPTSRKANRKNDGVCVICWEKPADAACIPCGHVAGCTDCLRFIKCSNSLCPVCRKSIREVLRIYFV